MPSPPAPSHPESDLEGTAELPLLDPAAEAAAREQRQSQTDTWIAPLPARLAEALAPAGPPAAAPPPAGAAPARQAQLTEQALSAKLHETQDLLASKSARLTQVERARDEVHAARAAAEQRAAQRNAELGQVRAELAFQLDELARSRAQCDGQLAQARALLSAASARADDLQRRFEEQESAARTQRAQELEHRQRAAQDRGRAAGFMNELHRERARALSFLESLQSAEGRRQMLEGLVTDLQRQAEERERDVARVARELEGRDALARERDAELAQRATRIARLEEQTSSLATGLAQRDTRSEEHTSELQSPCNLVCRLLLEKNTCATLRLRRWPPRGPALRGRSPRSRGDRAPPRRGAG